MNIGVDDISLWTAILLLLLAGVIVLFLLFRSLQLAVEAAQGKKSVAKDEQIPKRYATFMMSAAIFAIIGTLLLAPNLIRLAPLAIFVSLLITCSVWLNFRIRLYAARIRTSSEDSQQTD